MYAPPPANPAQAYLRRQIEQATPLQTTLMLLDGILKFTQQAKDAVQRADVAGRYNANRKGMEITTYMLGQTDPADGEASLRLSTILMGVLQRQMQVDFKNTPEACDAVAEHVRQLRAGFASLQAPKVVQGPEPAPMAPKPLAASA